MTRRRTACTPVTLTDGRRCLVTASVDLHTGRIDLGTARLGGVVIAEGRRDILALVAAGREWELEAALQWQATDDEAKYGTEVGGW